VQDLGTVGMLESLHVTAKSAITQKQLLKRMKFAVGNLTEPAALNIAMALPGI
jgi:hypothetical protein